MTVIEGTAETLAGVRSGQTLTARPGVEKIAAVAGSHAVLVRTPAMSRSGAPYGDATVQIPGFAQKVGPLSSVTGCALANALVAETVGRLVQQGYEPPALRTPHAPSFVAVDRKGK